MVHQRLVIETKDDGDTRHGSPEAGDRNKGCWETHDMVHQRLVIETKDGGDTRHGSPEAAG